MSVKLVQQYQKVDEKTKLPLNQIYVKVGENYHPLSELSVYVSDSESKKISSFKDFLNAKRVVTKSRTFVNSKEAFSKEVSVPTLYESDYVPGGNTPINLGLKRAHKVETLTFSLNDEKDPIYLYAKLNGNSNYDFYRTDELGYYENGQFVTIANKTLDEIKDKVIYSSKTNKSVENLYTDASFKFGNAVAVEQFDKSNLTQTVFVKDDNGNIVTDETGAVKTKTESYDNRYSEQTFKKIDGKTYVETITYDVNGQNNGDLIQIVFKGEKTPVLVNKNDLYLSDAYDKPGAKISAEGWQSGLIGKSLYLKVGEDFKQTEPLTVQQFNLSYDAIKTMQPSMSDDDICAENAYLRLENGKLIKETEVAKPIAYQIVNHNDVNFDALLVYYTDENGDEKSVVVDKSTFDQAQKVVVNGINLDINNAYKIRQCALSKSCHVIQTTSKGAKTENCVSIAREDIGVTTDEKGVNRFTFNGKTEFFDMSQIDEQTTAMLEAYKKGEYQLSKYVDDEGNVTLMDGHNNRFVFSEKLLMELDPTNKYSLLRGDGLTYDGKELKGGPHFDLKKANKAGFKKYRNYLKVWAQLTFSVPGVLLMATVPVLAITAAAATLIAPVLIPSINSIRAALVNRRKSKFENPTTSIRKQTEKTLEKELQELYTKTKEATAALSGSEEEIKAGRDAIARKFVTDYELISRKIDALHTSKFNQEFKMVDGKGKVDENNASLMSEFKQEIDTLDEDIKRLKKLAKKDPTKQTELDAKLAEKEGKLKFYQSRGIIVPKSDRADKMCEKAEMVKGLILAKFFQVTPTGEDELNYEQKQLLASLDYSDQKFVLEHLKKAKSKDKKKKTEKEKAKEKFKSEQRKRERKEVKQSFKDKTKRSTLLKKLSKNGNNISFDPELDIVSPKQPVIASTMQVEPQVENVVEPQPVVVENVSPQPKQAAPKKKSVKDNILAAAIRSSHISIMEKLSKLDTEKKISNFAKKYNVSEEMVKILKTKLSEKIEKQDSKLLTQNNKKCYELYSKLMLAFGDKSVRSQFEVENTTDTGATV